MSRSAAKSIKLSLQYSVAKKKYYIEKLKLNPRILEKSEYLAIIFQNKPEELLLDELMNPSLTTQLHKEISRSIESLNTENLSTNAAESLRQFTLRKKERELLKQMNSKYIDTVLQL